MDAPQLASLLVAMGCPRERSDEMALQLGKRARQMMESRGCSEEEALSHLISLMRQGWAARERGL